MKHFPQPSSSLSMGQMSCHSLPAWEVSAASTLSSDAIADVGALSIITDLWLGTMGFHSVLAILTMCHQLHVPVLYLQP